MPAGEGSPGGFAGRRMALVGTVVVLAVGLFGQGLLLWRDVGVIKELEIREQQALEQHILLGREAAQRLEVVAEISARAAEETRDRVRMLEARVSDIIRKGK